MKPIDYKLFKAIESATDILYYVESEGVFIRSFKEGVLDLHDKVRGGITPKTTLKVDINKLRADMAAFQHAQEDISRIKSEIDTLLLGLKENLDSKKKV
jgi:hypothetical protein